MLNQHLPSGKVDVKFCPRHKSHMGRLALRIYATKEPELSVSNPISHLKPLHHSVLTVNSLLTVSRYIDTAFADKGSHQKKIYNQNVQTHLSSDY